MSNVFRVSVCEVEITPSAGLTMDGYMARSGVSTGSHDPLLAQVLVLDDGELRAAVIAIDVMGVSASFSGPVRSSLAVAIGTTEEAILMCASHTHGGPAGLQDWFPISEKPALNEQLIDTITAQLVNAAHKAVDRLIPVQFSYGTASVEQIGMDRNIQHTPEADPFVSVLRFDTLEGAPSVVMFHYACHPTVLGPQLQYSADFPGASRRQIQTRYPIVLFLNGAAGNISTRLSRRDQSFDEVNRLGTLLGNYAIEAFEKSQLCTTTLQVRSQVIELPLRKFESTPVHALKITGNQRIDQTRAEGAIIEGELTNKFKNLGVLQAELYALHIGPVRLLFVPGEAFNQMAADLRRTSSTALVIGYTNDYLGYFPTQQAIDDQTYEALSSPYDARAHNIITHTLSAL